MKHFFIYVVISIFGKYIKDMSNKTFKELVDTVLSRDSKSEQHKLIYQWVKTGKITFSVYKELVILFPLAYESTND